MNATRIWNCLAKWRSHEWCDVTGENQDLYRAQRVDKNKIAVNPLECSLRRASCLKRTQFCTQ